MELKDGMVVRDKTTGTMWLLQGGSKGQYDMGWNWDALEVKGVGTTLILSDNKRNIDSVSDASKFTFFFFAKPSTTWYFDGKKTDKYKDSEMESLTKSAKSKLSKDELEVLAKHYKGNTNG